jgi:hypothetical protein
MPKETQPGVTSSTTENKKLVYVDEFRNLLRENPGIIKTAIALTDKAIEKYNPPNVVVGKTELKYEKETGRWLRQQTDYIYGDDGKITFDESGGAITKPGRWITMDFGRGTILYLAKPVKDKNSGLEVAVLGRSNRDFGDGGRIDKCDYLKMTIKNKSFFVKRSFISINPGFTEFENTTSAKELLKDFEFVKVVEAQLGYQDKNESWYVSKWEEFETDSFGSLEHSFDDYGNMIGRISGKEEYEDAEQKAKQIKEKLREAGIHRDLGANLFYSRKIKSFFLLDVTGEDPSRMLGNPMQL